MLTFPFALLFSKVIIIDNVLTLLKKRKKTYGSFDGIDTLTWKSTEKRRQYLSTKKKI